jgi:hypothetical protein
MKQSDPMSAEKKLIDDCFYVVKARFLWHSYDKDDNGLVSALTEEHLYSYDKILSQRAAGGMG